MGSVETDGELSDVVHPGNIQTVDKNDTSVDQDNVRTLDLAPSSVDPDEQARNFNRKSWREDLELVVEGKTLHVASNILSLLSPVFTAMFEERFQRDGPRRIELVGKKHGDVVQFLHCLYPNICQEITEDNVFQVLPLADEFKVKQLKKQCEEFLVKACISPLSNERICEYLQYSSRYDLALLRAKCVKLAASIDPEALAEAEKKHPLPPEIKIEVQAWQNRNLRKTISRLRSIRKEHEVYHLLMKEFLIYNLATKEGKERFRHARECALTLTISQSRTFQMAKSHEKAIHEIVWHCFAYKKTSKDNGDQLSLYLKSKAPEDRYEWKCEVLAVMWLLNKDTGKHLIREFTHTFTPEDRVWGYAQFISMEDLTSGGKYMADGVAQVNVYFLVNTPTWKLNSEEASDATDDSNDDYYDEDNDEEESETSENDM